MRVPEAPKAVAIANITPDVECGRYAVKRVVGDAVRVEADVFTHGHDELAVRLEYRSAAESAWNGVEMAALGNDRWRGEFVTTYIGEYRFRVVGWRDELATWRRNIEAKLAAGQDIALEREERAQAEHAAKRARADATVEDATSPVWVDRPLARFSTWYELFARSTSPDPSRPGTLRDVIDRLPYVAGMGFDVLYLPPIHPIGEQYRKGPNNTTDTAAGDPGSPWAIGSAAGGHTSVHPDLGTLDDFDDLVTAARVHHVEIALDLAFQTSPDHPWVHEHPDWFRHRADGSIAYAENPPKKYQDIYPIDFDCQDWPALWEALLGVVQFWANRGVRIFRVDNPHTKPFAFWEWLIARVRETDPDVIFLAEAFTRPRVMEQLAKVGFTQSYTYFTWRNAKFELIEYFTQLSSPPMLDYFRPNAWPNTPDILHESLQTGTRSTFLARLILAAGLSANYGIYGPVFELQEQTPREPGAEEYLNSEKYEIRHWDLERPESLRFFIAHVNAIRHAHPALQRNDTLRFHDVDNEQLICWSKRDPATDDVVVCVVNLDGHHVQSGWVSLDAADLGIVSDRPLAVHDVLTDARYVWSPGRNFVRLDPASVPAHIFAVSPARSAAPAPAPSSEPDAR